MIHFVQMDLVDKDIFMLQNLSTFIYIFNYMNYIHSTFTL